MKCPWLIKTTVINDIYNNEKIERQEFDDCMMGECPYYVPGMDIESISLHIKDSCARVKDIPLTED